jgi:hypothetical protein
MIGGNSQAIDLGFFSAEADLRTKQYYAVEFGTASPQVDLPDSNGDRCVGILQNKPNTGEESTVRMIGPTPAWVDGTTDVAYGDPLKVASGGTLVKAASDADNVVGYALEPHTENAVKLISIFAQFGLQRAS